MPTIHPTVHPTAILEGSVEFQGDASIGPGCMLSGPITIGPGTRLIGQVFLQGPLTLGADNLLYPFVCLGYAPQHLKFDRDQPGPGLTIGNGNTFREHVTVHRAFSDDQPSRVGDRNYFMVGAHAGHDCVIGDDCILTNGAMLGGHVEMDNNAMIGGNSAVHQFCRVGRGAMVGGSHAISQDLPPFFLSTGVNVCGHINLVGLRRSGMSSEEKADVQFVFKTLYRQRLSITSAMQILRDYADRPMVAEYLKFIEGSKKGILSARGRRLRSKLGDE